MAIGIIYGAQSGIVRRIVIPDHDSELQGHVGPGEALLILPDGMPSDVHSATDAVAIATGKRVPSNRCEVVDAQGVVRGVIAADPMLDYLPGHTLRQLDDQ